MTWPGSGYAGRRFPAGRVRPRGHSGVLFVFPLACLLLVWLLLPYGAAAEEDEYTLPDADPCHVILEGYKRFFGQRIDNYFLLRYYRKNAANMERRQRCCPGGEKTATKFRPKNADDPVPLSVLEIEVPAVFAKDASCASDIYSGKGKNWRESYSEDRANFWDSQYENITKNLHTCCVKHLNACLEGAFKQDTSEAGRERMSAESTSCLERFSPDYVAKAAEPSAAQTGPPPQERKESETTRLQQAAAVCTSDLARVRKEHDQLKQQAETDKAEITRLTGQVIDAWNENARNAASIRAAAAQTAPRPGIELLTGFPSAAGSIALAVLGAVVVTAGFFLGWPGRSRDSRTDAGGVSAVIAFGIFFFSVAFLPDTRFVDLLLAVTIAVLVVVVRTLIRSQIEVRHSGQTPPTSP